MRIMRDKGAIAALPDAGLRQLIEHRISQINECCPWDADELGPFIVVESGDTADMLETEMGFSVLRNLFDDTRFPHPDFAPAFEWAEAHPEGYFELVTKPAKTGDFNVHSAPCRIPMLGKVAIMDIRNWADMKENRTHRGSSGLPPRLASLSRSGY